VRAKAWAYSPLAVCSSLYTDAIPVCGAAMSEEQDEIAAIKIPTPTNVMRRPFIQIASYVVDVLINSRLVRS
jgi:hypothetical protein